MVESVDSGCMPGLRFQSPSATDYATRVVNMAARGPGESEDNGFTVGDLCTAEEEDLCVAWRVWRPPALDDVNPA